MTEIQEASVQEEITRLNKLKKQGVLTDREYDLMLSKVLHPQSSTQRRFGFQTMTPEEKRRKILLMMLTLGMLSILTGLGLIIGANWALIPYPVKLGGALALLAGALYGAFYCDTNDHPNIKELFLSAAFLLIAGNMAVIQQYMQLSLTWNQGSLIWLALSVPLLFFTKKIWLPLASTALFVFGIWDVIEWIFEHMNYMAICGILAAIVFTSFIMNGKKAKLVRGISLLLGLFILISGDIMTEDILGVISTIVLAVCLATAPKGAEGQVRFCHCLSIFIVWRIFLLFCTAYHNLMSMGIQLVVFGTALLVIAGAYYYFFDVIQGSFKRLVDHEE